MPPVRAATRSFRASAPRELCFAGAPSETGRVLPRQRARGRIRGGGLGTSGALFAAGADLRRGGHYVRGLARQGRSLSRFRHPGDAGHRQSHLHRCGGLPAPAILDHRHARHRRRGRHRRRRRLLRDASIRSTRGVITSLSFLFGALLSGISGYIGMYIAVRSNSRTASAARRSLGEALTVALRGGAVSGFLVVALGLLGVLIIYWVGLSARPEHAAGRGRDALLDRRLRLWRLLRRPLRPAWRRYLHQGRRRRRRPRRQGRGRHPRGRSPQPGGHRRPGRRQRRRLRRPRRRYLRVLRRRDHRRHDPGRDPLHRGHGRRRIRSRSATSSSRSSSARSAPSPRWSASSPCARPRLRRTPWTS